MAPKTLFIPPTFWAIVGERWMQRASLANESFTLWHFRPNCRAACNVLTWSWFVNKIDLFHNFPIQKWTVPTEQNISLFDQFIDQNVFKIQSWVEIGMSRSLSSPDREDGANFYCPGRKSSRVHSEEKSHRAIITHGQFQNSFQRSIRWQFFTTLKKSRNENKLGEKKVFA